MRMMIKISVSTIVLPYKRGFPKINRVLEKVQDTKTRTGGNGKRRGEPQKTPCKYYGTILRKNHKERESLREEHKGIRSSGDGELCTFAVFLWPVGQE
jgi:hypothetical protein